MPKTVKQQALDLRARGKSCLPVGRDKRALTMWRRYQYVVPEIETIEEWFSDWPDANIALPTGRFNGVVVIDCDSEEADGNFLTEFPEARDTMAVKTPRGYHYYFQYSEGVRNDAGRKICKGVDVRGDGGYVLFPPSSLGPDLLYSLITRGVVPQPLSDRLRGRLVAPVADCPDAPPGNIGGSGATTGDRRLIFGPGERNNQLTRLAGSQRHWGASYETILAALQEANENQCEPPLPESEIIAIARSACKWNPEEVPSRQLKSHDLVVTRVSDVTRQQVKWLWEKRIPIGRITLIEGDGGVAKSWLSLVVAAHVTKGEPLPGDPGGRRPGNVIIMSAEDSIDETIRAHLEDQGADTSMVSCVEGVRDAHGERPLTLGDVERLDLLAESLKPALIIIDPVIAFLGDRDMNHAGNIRSVLAPLHAMVQRRQCGIILIRHLNKSQEQSAKYRGQGSVDFYSACRSAFHVIPDSEDRNRRHFVHIKSNLGPMQGTLPFNIQDNKIVFEQEEHWDTAEMLYAKLARAQQNAKSDNKEDPSGRDDHSLTGAI